MLVELGVVEQRYTAVCEVLDGASVTDVAIRNGVARQTAHTWLRGWEPVFDERPGLPVPAEPFPVTNTTADTRAMLGMPPLD